MPDATIFQHYIFLEFILPFLLMFAIIFAILEKTKLMGEDKKQVNAIIAFVIGLIFVSAAFPKHVVNELILFLTIAIVVMFVFLILYGFVASDKKEGLKVENWMKWTFGILAGIGVVIATIYATGVDFFLLDMLFNQPWSGKVWTNVTFVVVAIIAITVVLKTGKKD